MFAGRITVTAVLEAMDDKANAVGLEVNWDKTKVEALGTHQSDQEVLDIHGHQAAVVSEFVYLGTLAQSSVYSSYDIHRHSGFTRSAMQNSDNCIWKSQLALSTKLQLYNICILPLVLYGSQCWALSTADASKIDALDQRCLSGILNVHWYQCVSNHEVCQIIEQPPLTLIIQKRCLMLFGHWVIIALTISNAP